MGVHLSTSGVSPYAAGRARAFAIPAVSVGLTSAIVEEENGRSVPGVRSTVGERDAGSSRTVCGVARLILINGAPGVGKSTIARRYAEDYALTLVLDVDQVRGMLGCWLDMPTEAGVLARGMAIEMARVSLREAHDVVVPQFLGRVDFILSLEDLCERTDAEFVEVALLGSREDVVRRFSRRTRESAREEHRLAAELLERSGGTNELDNMYDRLLEVLAARPWTRVVASVDGQLEQTYLDFLAVVSG
jgi:predicted kinase